MAEAVVRGHWEEQQLFARTVKHGVSRDARSPDPAVRSLRDAYCPACGENRHLGARPNHSMTLPSAV
jgi:hypothetical protein